MPDTFFQICTFIAAMAFAAYLGSIAGHTEVANDCDKQGSFYVGDRIYNCHRIEPKL